MEVLASDRASPVRRFFNAKKIFLAGTSSLTYDGKGEKKKTHLHRGKKSRRALGVDRRERDTRRRESPPSSKVNHCFRGSKLYENYRKGKKTSTSGERTAGTLLRL